MLRVASNFSLRRTTAAAPSAAAVRSSSLLAHVHVPIHAPAHVHVPAGQRSFAPVLHHPVTAQSPRATCTSMTLNLQTAPLHTGMSMSMLPQRLQQKRQYVFFPSSLKEARHDLKLWLDTRRKKRTILVRLIKQRYGETIDRARTTIRRRTRTSRMGPPSRKSMSIKYARWRHRFGNMNMNLSMHVTKKVTLSEYAKDDWFDEYGYPLTSRDDAGRFVNPWSSESTSGRHPMWDFLSWRIPRLLFAPPESKRSNIGIVPVDLSLSDPSTLRFTWIGHATCVIQLGGYAILTDPHFSHRAAPVQAALPFNGVGRHVPPACDMDDLPRIDVCLLTHDHYDHLDRNSCMALKPKIKKWVVPLGMKEWLMEKCEISEHAIDELEWWQDVVVEDTEKQKPPLRITSAPTQHWASRTMWDRNQRLWCSYVLEAQDKRFFFGGDTGFPKNFPLFQQIGQRLGPFDLAALPIGAYAPRFFMQDSHVNPTEAVQIHQDIRSKKSVAIHWGTFRLAEEEDDEPRQLLHEAVAESDFPIDFSTISVGESIEVQGSRK